MTQGMVKEAKTLCEGGAIMQKEHVPETHIRVHGLIGNETCVIYMFFFT
jgi:hypothetical protein